MNFLNKIQYQNIKYEVKILKQISKYLNIAKMLDYFENKKEIDILMEFLYRRKLARFFKQF